MPGRANTREARYGVTIDAMPFKVLAKQLRLANRVAYKTYRLRLAEAGEVVAKSARGKVSEYSKTIPATIKVRVFGSAVEVRAGGADDPIAVLFELGNKGSAQRKVGAPNYGKFRHPVFGNKSVWVDQDTHPYLSAAGYATRTETRRLITHAQIDALVAADLHPE